MEDVKIFSQIEYLELEKHALEKHEYRDGEIIKRDDSTFAHALISSNVSRNFHNFSSTQKEDFLVLGSQIKIFIEKANHFVYPDVVVIWEKVKLHPLTNHVIINPNLIIEITSETTEGYDRGKKFHLYSTLPSLKEYILIDQKRAIVDSFYRKEEDIDSWEVRVIEGLERSVYIHSLGFEINMADLYKKVPNLKNPQFNLDL